MQTWNPDCGKKTKFIYHPRARRTDAEPIIHKVNSLVVIGSFFISIYDKSLPRPTGKEKNRWFEQVILCAYFWTGGIWENQGRRFFLFISAFHRPYGGHRRMPPCVWYFIERPALTCQKKPCSRTGSAGLLLCTIQCSYCAFHTAIMPGWPFSVCWAFLLPPESLPVSKNIFGNFQKSGQNRVFQVSY